MPRTNDAQLNIRSVYARDRVRELARGTGMTAAEVIEDALRGYVPPAAVQPIEGIVERGPVLVIRAPGRQVTHQEAEAALAAVRERDL